MGNHGPMLLGVTGVDVDLVGTSSAVQEAAIGPGWKVGLPCHQRGKGMAWLCSIIWIGSVVGIGHACAMAVSIFFDLRCSLYGWFQCCEIAFLL